MDSCTVRGTVVDRIVAIKFWQFEQRPPFTCQARYLPSSRQTESYLYAACEIIPAALWRGAHMKYLLVSLLLVTVVWAEKVPNEADYPTEYYVVTTSAISGGLML